MPSTPSHEYRLLIERLGQAFNDGIEEAVGRPVDMGLPGSWDDHETEHRPVPIRAIIVRFGRPLRDMALFVSSLKEDVVRPIAQAAAASVLNELGIEHGTDAHGALGSITVEAAVEFATNAEAMEQCDGFYLEPTIHFALPMGDLCVVMGTGLLQSADCLLTGEADPFAEPLPDPQPGRLVLGDGIGSGDDSSRYEFGAGTIGTGDTSSDLVTAQVEYARASELAIGTPTEAGAASAADDPEDVVYTDQGPMSVAQYEAMLAAEAQADEQVAAAAHAAAAADANAAAVAAAANRADQPEQRWASLLSGVEVEVSAELGRTNLALGDLTSLVFDSVLTLDQMVDEPVNVYVNGTAYATARLVIVEGEFGIEILEVIGAAQLVEQLAA